MTKEQTLAGLAKSRQALHQAIEGLSEQEMTQAQVEGVWTIKDLIGHITSWDAAVLQPLRRYADGRPFETAVLEDYLTWNDEQAALKQDVPLDAILEEATAVREALVATANQLSAEQWEQELTFPWGSTGTLSKGLGGLAWHEKEHVETIQRWRDGRVTE